MKTKISIILVEVSSEFDPFGTPNSRILLDENDEFPSKYISTKTVEETLQELLYEYTSLDTAYSKPNLCDFVHLRGSIECEAIYQVFIPAHCISIKKGRLALLQEINIKDHYETSIQRTPRSIQ